MNAERDLKPRTKEFARRVIRLFAALSKDTAAQILGKQLLRAGTSVGANYREANRARTKAEFISKIGDCLKEADESSYWMELLLDEGFLPPAKLQPLLDEANELVAIFVTISKRARGD
ncbi:MAG TPA: four helix bundle protein [Verrucomicrobiae bacterium]|nr:four helix bundle protein [Verrucomicrobiae bacterium]